MSSSPLSAPLPSRAPVLADLLPGRPLRAAAARGRSALAVAAVRDALLVAGFALAIAGSAQLAIPLQPVPVTGQTFAVLLGAAALGAGRATLGAGLYGVVGLLGVPWFAGGGPHTLGYVVGFVLAAALVGRCARAGWLRGLPGAAAAMVAGNLVIWVAGVAGLALVLGLSVPAAVSAGVVPFLLGDALKIGLATALLPTMQRLVARAAD